jgi:cobalamin biosynthesis Mg chelatase CobN
MNQKTLVEKLLRIEALHSGATTEGERSAAANAKQRILERLQKLSLEDPPIEMQFSLPDPWSRKLFLALVRRYGLRPYRLYRQRASTVMVRLPKRFCDQTLWPEFEALSAELSTYLAEVTDRVISEGLHGDATEAQETKEVRALPGE